VNSIDKVMCSLELMFKTTISLLYSKQQWTKLTTGLKAVYSLSLLQDDNSNTPELTEWSALVDVWLQYLLGQ